MYLTRLQVPKPDLAVSWQGWQDPARIELPKEWNHAMRLRPPICCQGADGVRLEQPDSGSNPPPVPKQPESGLLA